MKTPVVFLIFNRPEVTARAFEAIARVRPEKLFVVADGPREGRAGERELCERTRAVVSKVDWPCDVQTNFAEKNMGLRYRVPSGLSWVFSQVERAIILEDDCVAHPSFFPFCEELLERFKDEPRIMHISGNNFVRPTEPPPAGSPSYYFTRYPLAWGWATWRRAWTLYEDEMSFYPTLRGNRQFEAFVGDRKAIRYWRKLFEMVRHENFNTWGTRWLFTIWSRGAISIAPSINLVSNIGFGPDATHTKQADNILENVPVFEMPFPLRHPAALAADAEADRYIDYHVFRIRSLPERLVLRLQRLLASP